MSAGPVGHHADHQRTAALPAGIRGHDQLELEGSQKQHAAAPTGVAVFFEQRITMKNMKALKGDTKLSGYRGIRIHSFFVLLHVLHGDCSWFTKWVRLEDAPESPAKPGRQ